MVSIPISTIIVVSPPQLLIWGPFVSPDVHSLNRQALKVDSYM